ncbi:hypothetical protein NQ318_004785 [Aromia moschata]|uniref:Uncharacterized protein n=1 Tax=Aromia moschata TaxID=1265417 RepID=A0AAV8XRB0_9CUCU|nr:hypothetical protein NQ318_004785 [Aromia moschata]
MFKKLQNESSIIPLKCGIDDNEENNLQGSEYSLLNVIGTLNIKRWNALKIAFACKTNENFVTKLLDIAQEHINRLKNFEDHNVSVNVTKVLRRINRNKKNIRRSKSREDHDDKCGKETNISNGHCADENNLPSGSEKDCNSSPSEKTESTTENNVRLDFNATESLEKINQNKNVSEKKTASIPKEDNIQKTQETDSDCNKAKENQNVKPSNLELTENNTCQDCSTSHAHDRCPIYNPLYKIKDGMDITQWSERHKKTYENSKNGKVKNASKKSDILKDKEKYSYSFGPLVGKTVKEVDIPEDFGMKDLWEIDCSDGKIYVNTEKDEKNLIVISREKSLYFVSVAAIKSGDELLYWQDSPFSSSKKKMEKTTCGCNMVFSHPHYYRIHCSIFHDLRYSLTLRKYHCKVCGVAVLGKENIMKHAAELHNGQGAYQCQFCKKFFLRLNYLEMHRTYGCSANPHRSRPLCDFCGKKFCQPQKLKMHIKRMHSDFSEVLREFQCKSCLKILGSRAALQRHLKEVHQKQVEDACSCSRCGKRFQNKSNLKIHMLTHSGIKPFSWGQLAADPKLPLRINQRQAPYSQCTKLKPEMPMIAFWSKNCRCATDRCNAAFTTKQCLQFHYKKVHNFTEENMPKIERSIDYTFQAYSGLKDRGGGVEKGDVSKDASVNEICEGPTTAIMTRLGPKCHKSSGSHNVDNPAVIESPPLVTNQNNITPDSSPKLNYNSVTSNPNIKVLSKGSKKWIADDLPHPEPVEPPYVTEKLHKDQITDITLQETDVYSRTKHLGISDFNRQDASNASLLVEAALDSVCSEPNIDIDVSTTPNCSDSLVNNLYPLTQPEALPDVSYGDTVCINDPRDINLISPLVTNEVSVGDELNGELRHNNVRMDYSSFHEEDFDAPNSPGCPNLPYEQNNATPVPSPPRYDFGHAGNADNLSSDDSNGMAAQNLSLHDPKGDMQLDLSIYKPSYKTNSLAYMRRTKFKDDDDIHDDQINGLNQDGLSSAMQLCKPEVKDATEGLVRPKYPDVLHNKFDIDINFRLKSYVNVESENAKKNVTYDGGDSNFKNKSYDLMDVGEGRSKQYDNIDLDFRIDRNFEPLGLNTELQGLDMSARSFHNFPNINRYHHLYPEVDRVDLRFNYSPPPPSYSHTDILRVVSLDLTPPGRHSVDLSLRNHPLHQIANTRLITEHGLQTNAHRLIDQSRILSTDLSSTRHLPAESRFISETSSRILSEHTTTRILSANDQLTSNHLLTPEQNRLIADNSRILSDQTRLLDQGRLMGEGQILTPTTPSGTVSPVQGFNGFSVAQSPYHPTIAPRQLVSSPTSTPYHHYPSYY